MLVRCMIFVVPAPAFADHFFTHQSNAANSFAHMTFLDSPSANNASSAFIFVTPDLTNAHADNHPIGVYYEGTRRRWAIYNQDAAPMPAGARFHVAVFRDSGPGITWINADGNHGNSAPFSRPLTDGHPDALIIATSVNNPGGISRSVGNPYPTGVWYDAPSRHWNVFNQLAAPGDADRRSMQPDASFNVMILPAGQPDAFLHRATAANGVIGTTVIDNPAVNGRADAILLVTPNWNPGGTGGIYDQKNIAVVYDSGAGRWAIMHEDSSPVPLGAAFNVRVLGAGNSGDRVNPGTLRITDISPDSPFGTASDGTDPAGKVAGIAVDPDGRTMYAASEYAGVWKSTDAGRTWTQSGHGLRTGRSQGVRDARFDPSAASPFVSQGLPTLVLDPSAPRRLIYAASDGDWFPASQFGGLWISTDGAANWAHVNVTGCPQPVNVMSVAFTMGRGVAVTRCGFAVSDASLVNWNIAPAPANFGAISAHGNRLFGCGASQIFRTAAFTGAWDDGPIRIPGICISLDAIPGIDDLAAVIYFTGTGQRAEVAIADFAHNRLEPLGFNRDQIGSGATRVFAARRPGTSAGSGPGAAFDVFATDQYHVFQFRGNNDWRLIAGVHVDTWDMAFSPAYDPAHGNCVAFVANDGGIHSNTHTGGVPCEAGEGPWVRAASGLHGFDSHTMAAIPQTPCGSPAHPCSALYVPSGDNGTWVSLAGGIPGTSWTHMPCCGDTGFALTEPGNPGQMMTGRNGFRDIFRSGSARPPSASDSFVELTSDEMPDGVVNGDLPPGFYVAQVQAVAGEAAAPDGDYIGFRSRADFPARPGDDMIIRLRNRSDWQVISRQSLSRGSVIEVGITGGHAHPTVFVLTRDQGIVHGAVDGSGLIPNWQSANGSPANGQVTSAGDMFVNPYQPGNVYVTDLGSLRIKVTTDSGAHWRVDDDLTAIATARGARSFGCNDHLCSLQQVIFSPNQPELRIAILTPNALAISRDSGAHWNSLSDYRLEGMPGVEKFVDLLTHAYSGAYEQDPATGLGTLYLAMRGRGVVRLDGVF
jgi:hypothetical protein